MPIMLSTYLQRDSGEPESTEVLEGVTNLQLALGSVVTALAKGRAHVVVVHHSPNIFFIYAHGRKYCVCSA